MDITVAMTEGGIRIEDWNQEIYRVYPTKWFEALLTSKSNGLVQPVMWDDPFENFFLKHGGVLADGTPVSFDSLANSWYGQCWTTMRDSDAMWRIYSADRTGIRVRTTAARLFSSMWRDETFAAQKYFIGQVRYDTREAIEHFVRTTSFSSVALGGQAKSFAETLLIKRPEFSHEREVRLLFHDTEKAFLNQNVWTYTLDVNAVATEIAFDPRLDEEAVRTQARRFGELGCTVPIIQSDLYKIDPIRVLLE